MYFEPNRPQTTSDDTIHVSPDVLHPVLSVVWFPGKRIPVETKHTSLEDEASELTMSVSTKGWSEEAKQVFINAVSILFKHFGVEEAIAQKHLTAYGQTLRVDGTHASLIKMLQDFHTKQQPTRQKEAVPRARNLLTYLR